MARNVFNTVPVRKPKRNLFNQSHDVKFSAQFGKLTPIYLQECIPGDKFVQLQSEVLIRFAPLLAPVMHNINVFVHYFFVPNRIVWENWEKFISPSFAETEDRPAWPHVSVSDTSIVKGKHNLLDYFGLPIDMRNDADNVLEFSLIPFAGYNKIWNEFYRDQNLQEKRRDTLEDGADNTWLEQAGDMDLALRAWQHDYFTASLPFAQKGPAVELPFSGNAEVYYNNEGAPAPTGSEITWRARDVNDVEQGVYAEAKPDDSMENNSLYADLSTVTSATINDLRVAMRLQEWFEKSARGGSRYIEQLMVHFGETAGDYRLQRPEFLGGTRNPVIISEVLQTSATEDSTTPQANMAGHGLSASSGSNIRYTAREHGYIFGIMSVMPKTAYQQGIPKHFTRKSWEDYAWPTFAHLGEQPVLNKEIFWNDDGLNDEVFGYVPRYSEYRYQPSRVAGDFRDQLSYWHLGRIFTNRPHLNSDFIECKPRTDIFAVDTSAVDYLWCHAFNKVKIARKLPKYGVPTL